MEENLFESTDRAFEQWKLNNPSGTYAMFSVSNQASAIRRGYIHPTLGTKTQRYSDFWEAGISSFSYYQDLLKISPHHKIVDYGCGSLRLGAHFIKYLNPGNYWGLDVTTDFIDMGKEAIGYDLLNEKQPRLEVIGENSLNEAINFGADRIISTACAFQIRPDEKYKYINDLKNLASQNNSLICFDTKISDSLFRYASSAYVWTLDFYREQFAP